MRTIALSVIVAVIWVSSVPLRAEAMLVPASATMQTTRVADMQVIQKTLESKILRAKLHALGLSDAEIQTRLDHLSDQDVHQLASQIHAVNPAGDVLIGILIIVLLVVLIIYLIKRV